MNWINEGNTIEVKCLTAEGGCPAQVGCSFCFMDGNNPNPPSMCILDW